MKGGLNMTITFRRYPCKCGCDRMIVDKQRVFRGFRYRLYCEDCRSFVQYANEEQKMILNHIKEGRENND